MKFINFQNDIEYNAIFTQCEYRAYWMKKYLSPHIQEVKLMFVPFSSSYFVEKGSSAIVNLLTKQNICCNWICNKIGDN